MENCRQQCGKGNQYQRYNNRNNCQTKNAYGNNDSMCGNRNNMQDSDITIKCKCNCDCVVEEGNMGRKAPVLPNCMDCPGMGPDPLEGMPLAMCYVPWQRYGDVYDVCEAMYHGTLFKELDLDFYGRRC